MGTGSTGFKRMATALLLPLTAATAHAAPTLVFDNQTGQVLHHEDAFELWSPASLTKLMTAFVVFEAVEGGNLTMRAPVRVTSNAASTPPSRMGYPTGAIMTVDNALKMIIVRSANDISVAVAEAVSGSEEAFVERMNEAARRLGMTQTNFVNPHGLPDPAQVTTARDMALLARALRTQFPQYAGYFSTEAIAFGEDQEITSYNLLLGRFDGADGMKTGFVCASGFNLIASATRDGRTVISVVMGAESQKERGEISARLLEEGFAEPVPADAPTLTTLPEVPDRDGVPADLRPVICTAEARAARWDGRDVDGNIVFDTPLIKTRDREPRAVRVGLGGAEGESWTAIVVNGEAIGGFPVPSERPMVATEQVLQDYGLRPGFDVPVPPIRPERS